MGNIFKRKDEKGRVTYTARVRRRGYSHMCATFQRKTDAEAWVAQQEVKLRQGLHFDEPEAKKVKKTCVKWSEDDQKVALRALRECGGDLARTVRSLKERPEYSCGRFAMIKESNIRQWEVTRMGVDARPHAFRGRPPYPAELMELNSWR